MLPLRKILPILFLVLFFILSLCLKVRAQEIADLKKLTANKEDVEVLKKAHELYKDWLAKNPQDFDRRIEADDSLYYIVVQVPEKAEKKKYLAQGIEWSKQAIALKPEQASGHFFYGMFVGLNASLSDFITGLKSKDIIKDEMEKVVKLDPNYSDGDAYIALGQWYAAVPFFLGGNNQKAKEYLLQAVRIAPQRAKPHLALAEFYTKNLQYDFAKKEIEGALATPLEGPYAFENKRDKAEAQTLLQRIEGRLNQPTRPYAR